MEAFGVRRHIIPLSEFDDIDVGRKVLIAFVILPWRIEKGVSVCAFFGSFIRQCHFVYKITLVAKFHLKM